MFFVPTKEHHFGRVDCSDTFDCDTFDCDTFFPFIEVSLFALVRFLRPDHVLVAVDHAVFPGGNTIKKMEQLYRKLNSFYSCEKINCHFNHKKVIVRIMRVITEIISKNSEIK